VENQVLRRGDKKIFSIGATFFKSEDNLFVFKAVKDSEFFMFYDFAPMYFQHIYKHIYEN